MARLSRAADLLADRRHAGPVPPARPVVAHAERARAARLARALYLEGLWVGIRHMADGRDPGAGRRDSERARRDRRRAGRSPFPPRRLLRRQQPARDDVVRPVSRARARAGIPLARWSSAGDAARDVGGRRRRGVVHGEPGRFDARALVDDSDARPVRRGPIRYALRRGTSCRRGDGHDGSPEMR